MVKLRLKLVQFLSSPISMSQLPYVYIYAPPKYIRGSFVYDYLSAVKISLVKRGTLEK